MRWVRSNLVVSSDSFASPRWVGSCENPLPAQGGAQHVATEPPNPEQSPAATPAWAHPGAQGQPALLSVNTSYANTAQEIPSNNDLTK